MQANEGGAPLATGRSVGIIRNNPYGLFRKQSRHPDDGGKENENTATAPTTPTAQQQQLTMGIQSQLLMGSVKSNMRKGGKRKQQQSNKKNQQRQKTINGSCPFNQKTDCKTCEATLRQRNADLLKEQGKKYETGISISHHGHHARCTHNQKTKGGSAESVRVDRVAAANVFANNARPVAQNIQTTPTDGFFLPTAGKRQKSTLRKTVWNDQTAAGTIKRKPVGKAAGTTEKETVESDKTAVVAKNLADGASLRAQLQRSFETYNAKLKDAEAATTNECLKDETTKYPKAMGFMVDYICEQSKHWKHADTDKDVPVTETMRTAKSNYRQFFAKGSLTFTFPPDTEENPSGPCPDYHMLEGSSLLYVDWKLAFPGVPLLCPNPSCSHKHPNPDDRPQLFHERTNYSKRKSLFPVWNHAGLPAWCIIMTYKCQTCDNLYQANDGRILAGLPPPVRRAYPVLPKYATGTFHLHRDFTDDMEPAMRTYANGKFVSEKLYRKMHIDYTRKVETYLSLAPTKQVPAKHHYTGGTHPPTDEQIRSAFVSAEESNLTSYAYSNCERYKRELQSSQVREGDKVAFDHTFQTLKNYRDLPGAKAIFTGINGRTKEILFLAIVPTTAASDISHLLLQAIEKRIEFRPGIVYTDTCPSNDKFWKEHFGEYVKTKLGLFHLMQRIVETMDCHSELYWRAMVELKKSMYTYDSEDEANLIQALKNGKFGYRAYTDKEIRQLERSKRWNQRYSTYLRKNLLPGQLIIHHLTAWLDKWVDRRDHKGRKVCTVRTSNTTKEQIKKVEAKTDLISDPTGVQMYQRIPPGPRSLHNLPKWWCDRPEALLEHFHLYMAHYGNPGMREQLVNLLTMGGTSEYNVKQRHKRQVNNKKLNNIDTGIIGHFKDLPLYYDHSLLHHLNEEATRLKLTPPFEDVHQVQPLNGEKFLSDYFHDQVERNLKSKADTGSRCECNECPRQVISTNNNTNTSNIPSGQPLHSNHQIVPPFQFPFQAYAQPQTQTDCSFQHGGYCEKYVEYLNKKVACKQVKGRAPHDTECPIRKKTAYWAK